MLTIEIAILWLDMTWTIETVSIPTPVGWDFDPSESWNDIERFLSTYSVGKQQYDGAARVILWDMPPQEGDAP